METIKNYLDNVFSALPKTTELLNLKSELENNMLDKYEELKSNGKSNNEAIGIVISEFGNIDEILEEMEISPDEMTSDLPTISLDEAHDYISLKKKLSLYIGIGVSLILFGVASLISLYALMEQDILFASFSTDLKGSLPVIFLLMCIAISVMIFISTDHQLSQYKYIEENNFSLSTSTRALLNKEFTSINHSSYLIPGVTLCILSPVSIFIGSSISDFASTISVSVLLLIIMVAVFIFIYYGSEPDSYQRLLQLNDYALNTSNNRVLSAIASIIWPVAVCIFLLLGFLGNLWHICWIIFPITGILYGGFCACYKALTQK